MTKKKILIYFDDKDERKKNHLSFLLKNMNYKDIEIDLIIDENIKIKKQIPKKVNIQEVNLLISKNKIMSKVQNFFIKINIKLKIHNYDASILYSPNSLIGNYCVRKASKNRIIFIQNDYRNLNYETYRKYFITRNIYDFNTIIFKNYQEHDNFLKHYPSLSKKTTVINDLINYEEIEKLSKEEISEKIKRTDKTILLIKDLHEEKNNILEKLKLIKDIKVEIPNIKLFIIGDGIDKLAYETFIDDNNLKENVILLGNKKNIYPYMNKCKYILLENYQDLDKYLIPSIVLNTKVISSCRYIDDIIELNKNFGFIVLDNIEKQKKEMIDILKQKNIKNTKIDFEKVNKEKIAQTEQLIKNNHI